MLNDELVKTRVSWALIRSFHTGGLLGHKPFLEHFAKRRVL